MDDDITQDALRWVAAALGYPDEQDVRALAGKVCAERDAAIARAEKAERERDEYLALYQEAKGEHSAAIEREMRLQARVIKGEKERDEALDRMEEAGEEVTAAEAREAELRRRCEALAKGYSACASADDEQAERYSGEPRVKALARADMNRRHADDLRALLAPAGETTIEPSKTVPDKVDVLQDGKIIGSQG